MAKTTKKHIKLLIVLLTIGFISMLVPRQMSSFDNSWLSRGCPECTSTKGTEYKLGIPYGWLTITEGREEGGIVAQPLQPSFLNKQADVTKLLFDVVMCILVPFGLTGLFLLVQKRKSHISAKLNN